MQDERLRTVLERIRTLAEEYVDQATELTGSLREAGTPRRLSTLSEGLDASVETMERRVIEEISALLEGEAADEVDLDSSDNAAKRSAPRFKRRLRIQYSVRGEAEIFKGFSRDVGPQGLFIASSRNEPVGTILDLTVEVLPGIPLKMSGTVVWEKWLPPSMRRILGGGFGVRVVDPPEAWLSQFA